MLIFKFQILYILVMNLLPHLSIYLVKKLWMLQLETLLNLLHLH